MIRNRRSDVLWITRGMRIGEFLRCCAGTVSRYLRRSRARGEAPAPGAVKASGAGHRSPLNAPRAAEPVPGQRAGGAPACARKRPPLVGPAVSGRGRNAAPAAGRPDR